MMFETSHDEWTHVPYMLPQMTPISGCKACAREDSPVLSEKIVSLRLQAGVRDLYGYNVPNLSLRSGFALNYFFVSIAEAAEGISHAGGEKGVHGKVVVLEFNGSCRVALAFVFSKFL